MAILVNVKMDLKDAERALQDLGQKAKAAFDRTGIGDAVKKELKTAQDAFSQITNNLSAFKARLTSALDPAAIQGFAKHIGGVAQGGEQAAKSLVLMAQSSGVALTAVAGLGVGVAAATGQIIAMAQEGAKLADEMGKLAKETGKSFDEIQKLEKGGRDLTAQLTALDAVLDGKVIENASRATDQFALLGKQWDSVTIRLAAELRGGFDSLGRSMNQLLKDATPGFIEFGRVIGQVMEKIGGELQKVRADIAGLLGLLSRIGTFGTLGLLDDNLDHFGAFSGQLAPPSDPNRLAFSRSNEALLKLLAPGFTSPNARAARVRTGGGGGRAGGSAIDRPPDLPQDAQEALDRLDFAIDLMGKNLTQLAEIQARNSKELEQARSKQFELEQRNLTTTKEYLALREQTVKLENRNLELLGAKLTQIEQGGTFDVKLLLGKKPGLEGPGLTVPGASQDEALLPLLDPNRPSEVRRRLNELQDIYREFGNNVTSILEQTFADSWQRGPGNFFTRMINSLKETFARLAFSQLSKGISNAITPALFGIFGGGGAQGGSPVFGGGGGVGGILGGLFGGVRGGGFGGFLTPPFNPNAGIGIPASISGGQLPIGLLNTGGLLRSQPSILGGTIGGSGGIGGLFSGLGGIGALLGPALLGGALGAGFGGSSRAGQVLGALGGAAAGVGIAGGVSVGLAGGGLAIGALAALGPLAFIAAPLIIGAILLGKASQRKKDEKAADEIWVNEMNQIRQLIAQVNGDRIDGQEALAAAAQLRSQTVAGLNQIKTKSVRESRLNNQLRDLDNGVVAELRRAVERQATRQRIGPQLIPEFATGGRVPGIDSGFDSVLARLRPGEAVLNQQHIALMGGNAALRRAGVPGFANGGQIQMTPSSSPGSYSPITIIFEEPTVDAEGIFVKGARTSKGERVIVQTQRDARLNRRA